MNVIIRGSILALTIRLLFGDAFAQGTVYFSNYRQGTPNAPVYQADGITKLSGSQFMAELFAGLNANNLASVATTSFLTGNGAGYFDGGIQTLTGVSVTATVWVQVKHSGRILSFVICTMHLTIRQLLVARERGGKKKDWYHPKICLGSL